jgi:peptide-methionine (S)-S-oxide reductase
MVLIQETAMAIETATFGAGCFWGVELTFSQVDGVVSTAVGYMGGAHASPSYEDVCSGTTGHAEVVHVKYDPDKVGYDALLDVFWDNHNPTTADRQGPDVGTQYRSVIFYHSEDQRAAAEASKAQREQSGRWPGPIVTQVVAAETFHLAEDYHQQYLAKRGQSSCSM